MKLLHVTLLLVVGLAMAWPITAIASSDAQQDEKTKVKIEQIRQERLKLLRIRKQLEAQLGALGKELQKLDKALVQARKENREAAAKVGQADKKLRVLKEKRRTLEKELAVLKERMLDEAVAAYQHAGRASGWSGSLAGASMREVPHRRFMLNQLLASQVEDRMRFQQHMAELVSVERDLQIQRDALAAAHREKEQAEQAARTRFDEKQQMAQRVRHDARLKKRRDAQLAREEKALHKLLEGLAEDLLVIDRSVRPQSVRRLKGKLPWPLRGRIVAKYGSRPTKERPRLSGVQLAPRDTSRQVKSIAAGQVRYADWFGGYGLMMIVDHGNGVISVYAHNDALYRQLGDWIEAGDVVADAGSTGWIEDVRLYFEVREAGRPVNPARWCRRQ